MKHAEFVSDTDGRRTESDLYNTRKRTYRAWLFVILLASILAIFTVMYVDLYQSTPGRITIIAGSEQSIDLNVPLSGTIVSRRVQADPGVGEGENAVSVSAGTMHVDFSAPVRVYADKPSAYVANVKVFGIIPFKQIRIDVIDNLKLIPAGTSIGIYMKTTGIYVVGCATFESGTGTEISPCEYLLRAGDVILAADNVPVSDNQTFIQYVEESEGRPIFLDVLRKEEEITVKVAAQQNADGIYRLGIWIKDSAQGIGTLTYVSADCSYGALGHGISDKDTAELIPIASGSLFQTQIVNVRKGVKGEPGEMTGLIRYTGSHKIGTIEGNTEHGIYGVMEDTMMDRFDREPLSIATSNEMKCGPATILCTLEDEVCEYEIEIEKINHNQDVSRGLTIHVTDQELLELAGGIIQGMSGSPIIQDGRLIGAVTHVLVNDPTRGYGIFIEEMLKQP